MKQIIFYLLILLLIIASSKIYAQIPREINYQGVLLSLDREPVPDQEYKLTFKLYEEDHPIWAEIHANVPVTGGHFQVMLGSIEPLFLPFDRLYFLGIQIGDNEPELEPRMFMSPSPYSFRADDANRVGGFEVSGEPAPGVLFPLGENGKFPASVLPASTNGNYLKKNRADTSRATINIPLILITNLGNGDGINGRSIGGIGVSARSDNNDGVVGWTNASDKSGVYGHSVKGIGVTGRSTENYGVFGATFSTNYNHAGVHGINNGSGPGVHAVGGNTAIWAESVSGSGTAVKGRANGSGYGGWFWATGANGMGVNAQALATGGIGIYAKGGSGGYAGDFDGTIRAHVVEITGGSDLSEKFDIDCDSNLDIVPGMVVSIDSENFGKLKVSAKAYDRKVAGIISGAGGVNPGMLMGQKNSEVDGTFPVALTGRVYCIVDASYGAIEPGDLLTASDTPGHAMKVTDYNKAQGAIIGKAMSSLESGAGLVLVLVTLQ